MLDDQFCCHFECVLNTCDLTYVWNKWIPLCHLYIQILLHIPVLGKSKVGVKASFCHYGEPVIMRYVCVCVCKGSMKCYDE